MMYSPEALERGIAYFNEGRYVECHEAWEEIWRAEEGQHRRFLQALIQAASGVLHATRGNVPGAINQLTRSLDKLEEYPPSYLGIDLAALRPRLQNLCTRVAGAPPVEGGAIAADDLPKIQYMRELSSRLGRFRETDE